uniref:Uncharacterized protein n=1 Tax=Mycena chlorophos TaxID=658473 RepID=A0ABQ0L677_MYCCL|nr:predicted protein [Mycena chlorophos]
MGSPGPASLCGAGRTVDALLAEWTIERRNEALRWSPFTSPAALVLTGSWTTRETGHGKVFVGVRGRTSPSFRGFCRLGRCSRADSSWREN